MSLVIYVVYKHPKDYPANYVVRRWVGVHADLDPTAVVGCLAEARQAIPDSCVRIERDPQDDAAIEEVWL